MKTILYTERLHLREFDVSDAKKIYELNADPEVIRYTGDKAFVSVAETRAFLENYSDYKRNGYGRWIVELKDTNEVIGWCGLKKHSDGMVDIGYRFFRKNWGKGYATESAKACIKYGFEKLGIHEIIGRSAEKNIASCKVLENIGLNYFKRETCDGLENAKIYKILRPKTIVLVACVKEKQNSVCLAKDMYKGDLFPEWMKFAESLNPSNIFILSGKYGLLNLDDEIEPYDVNLNLKAEEALKNWSKEILTKLKANYNLKIDKFIILTNEVYSRYLVKEIVNFEIPFEIE